MTTLEHRFLDDGHRNRSSIHAARAQIAHAAEDLLGALNELNAGGVLVAQNTTDDAHVILELSVSGAHELAATLRKAAS